MSYPKVAIIILNWNGLEDTIECLSSLEKISYPNYHIFLIDNNSDKKEITLLSELFKKNITFIQNKENLGFAEGNNVGIRRALYEQFDYILLLNNDTLVKKDFLSEMVNTAEENNNIGIVGSSIYYYQSDLLWAHGGGRASFLTNNFSLIGNKKLTSKSNEVGFITGCSFLIKSGLLKKIGLLDSDYFVYSEEVDFCLRAKKKGYNLAVASRSIIWHKVARSSKYLSNDYVYYMMRNKMLLAKKHAKYHELILFIPLFVFKECLGYLILILLSGNYKALNAPFQAIKDFHCKNFGKYIS